jgi:hypothetical protein
MAVPYTFGTATAAIPLSQLDTNFATAITIGNTAVQLGNTVTTLNNMTLANVTISSGNVTLTNVSVTTANVSTANIVNSIITTGETLSYGTANGVAYLNGSKVLTTGSALVFDGTKFGVGASSPIEKIQSSSGIAATGANLSVGSLDGFVADYSSGVSRLFASRNGVASGSLAFWTTDSTGTAAERMRLDSSGNLGLGVTPSAWTRKALQLGDAAAAYVANNSGGATVLATNMYFDGGNKYATSAAAARYSVGAGSHEWYTAASGTAGNGISFTQAMTLDSSGNLGIGATAPQNKLQVVTTTRPQFSVSYNGTTGLYLEDGTNSSWKSWKLSTSFGNGSDLSFVQSTNTSGTPTWAATAAMTLDASGNLLVGKTALGLAVGTSIDANTSTGSGVRVVSSASTSSADGFQMYSTGAGAYRFYVSFNGTISATTTTISAISDARFKENVRDLDAGLAEVMALKPRLYDWKEGKGADVKNARGFIAQEFEEVFPDLIDEWKDPAPEGEEPYKSVRADIIPVLVKAIQEQQALITSLTERISALEAK